MIAQIPMVAVVIWENMTNKNYCLVYDDIIGQIPFSICSQFCCLHIYGDVVFDMEIDVFIVVWQRIAYGIGILVKLKIEILWSTM